MFLPTIISFPTLFISSFNGPNSGLADISNALSVVSPALKLEAINWSASGSAASTIFPFLSALSISTVYTKTSKIMKINSVNMMREKLSTLATIKEIAKEKIDPKKKMNPKKRFESIAMSE